MAVTHPSTVRNLIADTVTADLDTGTSNARMVFTTAATAAEVATLEMGTSAFGAAAAGVCTASTITDGTASTAGTVTICLFEASTEYGEVFRCAVTSTGGGGDIELSSNVISSGQTISITSLTYTAPT